MTNSYNPKNERLKRAYFEHLKQARGRAVSTVDGVRKAIARFELHSGFADFGKFNKHSAISFKRDFAASGGKRSGEPMSKSTAIFTLNALKAFFIWLNMQPGYRSRIALENVEYLNPSQKDLQAAKSPRHRPYPTLEQIRTALFAMPSSSDVELRDRALFALAALTAMRDGALVSLRLKHIDLEQKLVHQDPLEVRTKFSKRIETFFYPVGEDIETIFAEWVRYLRQVKLYGNDDPVFPRTRCVVDAEQSWTVAGVEPVFWSSAEPVRKIFRAAFERVGLPYFNPHSFRCTIVQLGQKTCQSPEEFKAWSQNIGHTNVMTTLVSYGHVPLHRQGELIRSAGRKDKEQSQIEEILHILKRKV
jgi:integrase